ncbi:MAG TPA: YlxR family protein [archaeon]|nr:YlxR family protein [archaeon]
MPDERPVLRTCVGCRKVRDRRELVRLAFDPAKGLILGPQRPRGRGAYLCRSAACLEKAWHRKALPRAFRREMSGVDGSVLRELFEAELRPIAR